MNLSFEVNCFSLTNPDFLNIHFFFFFNSFYLSKNFFFFFFFFLIIFFFFLNQNFKIYFKFKQKKNIFFFLFPFLIIIFFFSPFFFLNLDKYQPNLALIILLKNKNLTFLLNLKFILQTN
jgi:hypothetical protein